MFDKILIANRGEIACRIIKTAKKMGIATVAVYSEADRSALHVDLADEAVLLGPAPSRASYLLADKIIQAAKETGAQAIHPGYGFLSENEEFSRRVEEEGLVFIGPKHYSIAAMGDKIASKKLAMQAGVNTIPGWSEAIEGPNLAVEIARGIGYPVMIKASAGGGGKGLRVAWNDKEAHDGFTSCRNEAKASFGDERVFVEKFVEDPRHIEIQVLGDAFGSVVYLNERECSIQRRHQKVIEEAPSPFISEATRSAMGEQAVALAKAVNYQSAGTVEFVVGKDESFYFLEMNTRLQVEHPVTECITGLDLVELMIRVAAGEPLPFTQAEVRRKGWAIECRINAEDPSRNFLPSTGRLVHYQPPVASIKAACPMPEEGGVRVDTGVCEGGEIPMHYDSMIAKLIVHGRDRSEAISLMREALNGFVIRGISSNVLFQSALLSHPKFVSGEFNTGFIAEHFPDGYDGRRQEHHDPCFLIALAAFARRKARERAVGISGQLEGRHARAKSVMTAVVLDSKGEHRHFRVKIENFDPVEQRGVVEVEDRAYDIQSHTPLGAILATGTCNGVPFTAQVERARTPSSDTGGATSPLAIRVIHQGSLMDVLVLPPRTAELFALMPHKPPPDLSRFLLSPMPGLLVDVSVEVGQRVQAGDRLAVIEAMKMENIITAAQDATVAEVMASQGESLSVDQPILRFEQAEGP